MSAPIRLHDGDDWSRVDGMHWAGEWSSHKDYEKNSVVTGNGWVMVANKDTDHDAIPIVLASDLVDIAPDSRVDTTVSGARSSFGHRYQFTEPCWVNTMRVYVEQDQNYAVYLIYDPEGAREKVFLGSIDGTHLWGWHELDVFSKTMAAYEKFDVIVEEFDYASPTNVVALWDYVTPWELVEPEDGQIVHASDQKDTLRVSYIDGVGIDRKSELLALTWSAGDTVYEDYYTRKRWYVLSATDGGTYLDVVIQSEDQVKAMSSVFTFSDYTPTTRHYRVNTDYWAGSTYLYTRGLYSLNGDIDKVVDDDNAYGVDVNVQFGSVLSPDWDVMLPAGPNRKYLDTDWQYLTLQNNWVNYSVTSYGAVKCKRVSDIVYLEMMIKDGTTTLDTVVTNLPEGFRPSSINIVSGVSSTGHARFNIKADGDVQVSSGASAIFSSLNVSFPADNEPWSP